MFKLIKKMNKFYFTGSFLLVLFFISCEKKEALTAIFNVSSPDVFEGYSLDFSDVSYGKPTAWEWSFQGGNPSVSNEKNPANIEYDTPGTYSVSLTVSNAEGTDSRTMQNYITVIGTGSTQVLLDNGHKISSILTIKPLDSLYGKKHEGGLIFYIDKYSSEYTLLISAEANVRSTQFTGAKWGCEGSSIPQCQSSWLGSGDKSTAYIVSGCQEPEIAARLCDDLILEGYSDWVLPSAHEISEMHRNLYSYNRGNFDSYFYWTSQEYNADKARALYFNANGTYSDLYKSSILKVRPIRILEYD
jgi:PKD repeat protein